MEKGGKTNVRILDITDVVQKELLRLLLKNMW